MLLLSVSPKIYRSRAIGRRGHQVELYTPNAAGNPPTKINGEMSFVCISKNIPLNTYSVILYKIMGSPPPHLCKKIRVRHHGRIGRRWHQVELYMQLEIPQLKSMAVSLQLSPKHPTLFHCISLWRPDLAISGEKSRPFAPTKILLV